MTYPNIASTRLLKFAGATLLMSSASAEDIPIQMDDAWRGWNVGVALLGVDAHASIKTGDGTTYKTESGDDPGFIAIQGGYTSGIFWSAGEFTGWRWGAQFDIGFGGTDGTATDPVLGELEIDSNVYLAGLGRLGYCWDRAWVYGLLGFSGTDFFVKPVGDDSTNMVINGTIGIGTEVRFNQNWAMNLEILTTSDGDSDQDFDGTTRSVSVDHTAIKLGATWRF